MVASRIASSTLHLQSMKDITSVTANLAKLNQQISSGKLASTFDELSGRVERVAGYETKLGRIDTYKANNSAVVTRLKTMDQKISTIQEIAKDFSSLIILRRNDATAAGLNFASQAEQLMNRVSESLNISIEGRYLFSGSATGTQPIADPMPKMDDTGTPDDNYYMGNGDQLKAHVSDSLEIQYGITANDPAFQKIFAAIRTALEGDSSNSDYYLAKAVDLTNEAIESLAALSSDVNSDIVAINAVAEDHDKFKLYWSEAVNDETSTDLAEATIKLSTDQTILQATFSAFAKLSGLKLTDYLK